MSVVLFFAVGILGFAFAAVIYRADPRRFDNRVFALLGLANSITSAYAGILVLAGYRMTDAFTLRTCSAIIIAIAYFSVEFGYSFPLNRPLPGRWRAPLLGVSLLALVLVLHPATSASAMSHISTFYFLPMFVLMVFLLMRNLRSVSGDRTAIYLVVGGIIFRWVLGLFAYNIARAVSPAFFEAAVTFELSVGSLLAYGVICLGFLRSQLFRVRGAAAELIVAASLVLIVVFLTVAAVEGALFVDAGPYVQRALLVLCALVPVAAYLIAAHVRERIDERIGKGFDRRRGLRREIISTAPRDPAALLRYVLHGLSKMSGGPVRYVEADALPPPLAATLATAPEPHLLRGTFAGELPGELVVAVRGGGRLHGALVCDGGEIDRDVVLAAVTLADNLALTLENRLLFGELEESRRLAALGQFAAAIAHDIRTPLTSISLNVQMLRRKANLPPDDMEHFDIALTELKRLETDVSQLLAFAKPVRLQHQTVDLREVAEEAARRMEPIYEEKRLALRTEHPPDLPPIVGDGEQLRQVVTNLLDNAARAQAAGEIVIRTRVDGGRVAIEVADQGEGIGADDLPRIFEPFFTTRPDGTGLGLAICAKLVRAHDGEILVRSARGAGSTFTVLLPAAA